MLLIFNISGTQFKKAHFNNIKSLQTLWQRNFQKSNFADIGSQPIAVQKLQSFQENICGNKLFDFFQNISE